MEQRNKDREHKQRLVYYLASGETKWIFRPNRRFGALKPVVPIGFKLKKTS